MPESQAQTGTRNETYDLVSVLYHALQGIQTCETYKQDSSADEELRSFFEQAQQQQRQLADRAKQLLQTRLGQGSSAFSFGQGEQGASAGQGLGGAGPATTGQTGGGSF